jgi:hypothetical protein
MPQQAAAARSLSFWIDSATLPVFPRLQQDHVVDVVIVGGGLTGLTTAYLLQKAGKRVALLERNRCAQVDTAYTTAHLTMVTDERLTNLVSRFGRDHAQAVWDAGLAAISQIDEIVRAESIACGFEWVAGYLHLPQGDGAGVATLQEDAALAAEMGFDASFVDAVPLMSAAGIRFDGQARFHPRQYLAGLARAIREAGGEFRTQRRGRLFCGSALRHRKRPYHSLRRHCPGDAQPAGRAEWCAQRHDVSDEACAVYQLRGRWPRRARHGARRTILGYRRSVPLLQNRTAS